MPRMRKNFIKISKEDTLLNQMMNDIKRDGYAIYNYKSEKQKQDWRETSRLLGLKAKELIQGKPPLLLGPSTCRSRREGFLMLPKNVDIREKPTKNGKIIYFTRIF